MHSSIVSVLIVESHPLMRDALAAAIASEPDWTVAAQVAANAAAIQIAVAVNPDMILMALGNPGQADLHTLRALRQALPTVAIMALTANEVVQQEQAALENGASDVMTKAAPRAELIRRVRALISTQAAVSSS